MTQPIHHPDHNLIYTYASGCDIEAVNLIMSTHIHSCPHCQQALADAEDVCGHFFAELPVVQEKNDNAFDALWDKITQTSPVSSDMVAPNAAKIVSPLENYIARNKKSLKYKNSIPNISETILPLSDESIKVSIMTIDAGIEIPQHTHTGYEMTQILSGGFYDQKGSYNQGDLTIKDSRDHHTPKIFDDEPCTCLVVRCGDLKFTGSMGLIYNSLFKLFD